jgi:hypothetical protein
MTLESTVKSRSNLISLFAKIKENGFSFWVRFFHTQYDHHHPRAQKANRVEEPVDPFDENTLFVDQDST